MALNVEGVITVLSGHKDYWNNQDSPNSIESETEDIEKCQETPQYILDSLSKYTTRKNGAYSKDNCSLCHSNYSVGDSVVCLPCHHNFHEYCIENWLKWVKPTCPVDKKSVIRTECVRQVEIERYQMKIQKLLLKEKKPNVSPKRITIKREISEEPAENPLPSPVSVTDDIRVSSPIRQADTNGKKLMVAVTSPLCKHLSRNNREKGSGMKETIQSEQEPTNSLSKISKQNPALRAPSASKSKKGVKTSTQKFNYPDFLKSLESPWNMPVLITSCRTLQKHLTKEERLFSGTEAKQKCSRVNRQIHSEGPKLFRKMVSRKCLTSAGLRYAKERRGGWVYKNDINLSLKRNGLCRKPKTA